MKECYLLTINDGGTDTQVLASKSARFQKKKISKIPLMSLILSKYYLLSAELVQVSKDVKITKNKLYIVPQMKNLAQQLKDLFPSEAWNLESPKAKELLKSYFITCVKRTFTGICFENIFGLQEYLSGEIITDDYYDNEMTLDCVECIDAN